MIAQVKGVATCQGPLRVGGRGRIIPKETSTEEGATSPRTQSSISRVKEPKSSPELRLQPQPWPQS